MYYNYKKVFFKQAIVVKGKHIGINEYLTVKYRECVYYRIFNKASGKYISY